MKYFQWANFPNTTNKTQTKGCIFIQSCNCGDNTEDSSIVLRLLDTAKASPHEITLSILHRSRGAFEVLLIIGNIVLLSSPVVRFTRRRHLDVSHSFFQNYLNGRRWRHKANMVSDLNFFQHLQHFFPWNGGVQRQERKDNPTDFTELLGGLNTIR